jgi:hypothetical protein
MSNPETIAPGHPFFAFRDVYALSRVVFGEAGETLVLLWRQFNGAFFFNSLRPVPLILVPGSLLTSSAGQSSFGTDGTTQYIYLPRGRPPAALRGALLHEMVHQRLNEAGKNPRHDGEPWCEEIVRISRLLGRKVAAGRTAALTGRPPLAPEEIAGWPNAIGLRTPRISASASNE